MDLRNNTPVPPPPVNQATSGGPTTPATATQPVAQHANQTQQQVNTALKNIDPAVFKRYYKSLEPIMKKPKNRVYTALVLSFLAIALFAWYAIRPTMQTILYLQREISDKTVVNQKMEEKIGNLISAQAAFEAAQSQLPLLDEAIPKNPEALDLASQLKFLAEVTSASISSMQITTVPLLSDDASVSGSTTPPDGQFTANLLIQGTYDALKGFIEGLSTLRRVTTVKSLNIGQAKETDEQTSTSSGTIEISLTLESFYRLK